MTFTNSRCGYQYRHSARIAEVLSGYDDLMVKQRAPMHCSRVRPTCSREWFVSCRFPGYEHAVFRESLSGDSRAGGESFSSLTSLRRIGSGATPRGGETAYKDEGSRSYAA